MARLGRKAARNPARRDEWMRAERVMCGLQVRQADRVRAEVSDDVLKRAEATRVRTARVRAARAEMKRLEAGGDAVVAGWEVGMAWDDSRYVLAGDGSLTPYESPVPPATSRITHKEKRI